MNESPSNEYSNKLVRASVLPLALANRRTSFDHPIFENREDEEDEIISKWPKVNRLDLNLVKSYDSPMEEDNLNGNSPFFSSKSAMISFEEESNDDDMFKEDGHLRTKVKLWEMELEQVKVLIDHEKHKNVELSK